MAGTLKTPSVTEPIKALGFYSFVVTIPDDDVYSFTPKGECGHIFLATTGTASHGLFWWRGGNQSKYSGAATTVGLNSVLTGTTGADGNLTFGASGGVLYIENRAGGLVEITVTLLSAHADYE